MEQMSKPRQFFVRWMRVRRVWLAHYSTGVSTGAHMLWYRMAFNEPSDMLQEELTAGCPIR
jgi:hypothetical protein